MADLAFVWIQLILLFVRYPHRNGLCAIFVLFSMCFIPTFALPDNYYASLEFSKLAKHSKGRSTHLDGPVVDANELTDVQTFRGSFSKVGAVKEAEGRIHWVNLFYARSFSVTCFSLSVWQCRFSNLFFDSRRQNPNFSDRNCLFDIFHTHHGTYLKLRGYMFTMFLVC